MGIEPLRSRRILRVTNPTGDAVFTKIELDGEEQRDVTRIAIEASVGDRVKATLDLDVPIELEVTADVGFRYVARLRIRESPWYSGRPEATPAMAVLALGNELRRHEKGQP